MAHTFVLALLLTAAGQTPSGDPIARQLDSHEPQILAWGAYQAAAYGRVDLISRLQQILQSPPMTGPLEERAVSGVVMDALIQLGARVPARLLLPYVDSYPVHALVLLSSAADREEVLVALLPRLSGPGWFAAANMLLAHRSPGLLAHLTRTVRLHLTVHVADRENVGFGSAVGAGMTTECTGQGASGYPPHTEYRLWRHPRPGLIILAPGPHAVYYSRTFSRGSHYPVSEVTAPSPTDEDRVSYLRAMSPDTGDIAFRAHASETVSWTTAAALLRRVKELRTTVEQRFQDLVARAGASLSLPAEAVVQPPVDVHLVDHRRDTTVPLPVIDR